MSTDVKQGDYGLKNVKKVVNSAIEEGAQIGLNTNK